jgi:hypothetical protein
MIELVSINFSVFVYGLLSTVALMAVLYFILHEINRNAVRNIPFFLTGIVLFVLLASQFTLLFGAMESKSLAEAAEIFVSQSLEKSNVSPTDVISGEDSQEMLNQVIRRYPILGAYVGICTFSGTPYSELAQVFGETLRDYFSNYIWRRLFWILGFVAIAMAIALLVPKAGYRQANNRASARRERYSSQRSERRPSRRR